MKEKNVFASIVGNPNAGKSTLINRLVGERIAITAPKPQTTRNRILGILTKDAVQYVFSDTPGYHLPKSQLEERMIKSVRDSVADVDVVLFLCEPKDELDNADRALIGDIATARVPAIFVLNKTDKLTSEKAQTMLHTLSKDGVFADAVAVSALTGADTDALLDKVAGYAKEGPHLYDDDALTDMPEKVIASEILREKLLLYLRDELPHGCAVTIESFKERVSGDILDVDALIVCEKDSHKAMIIGRGGQMLKKTASAARRDMERFFSCKVNLKCWVKVREGWKNNDAFLNELGY